MNAIASLADVLERLDLLPELSEEERRDMKNAIKKIGVHLHPSRNLALVSASGRQAMNGIEAVTASQLGRSKKTRDNLVSLTRKAIESCVAGKPMTTRWSSDRELSPVAAAWASILKREKDERGLKVTASRFAKWAEATDVMPWDLPEDAWELFLVWQRESSWAQDWEASAKHAVWAWNKLVVAGAPGRPVVVPKRALFMPKLCEFPDPFQQDVKDYEGYCRYPVEWCQKRPACRKRMEPYAEATTRHHLTVIRWAAALLIDSGTPIEELTSIGVLGTADNPTRIMESLEKRELARMFRLRAEGVPSERGEEKPSSATTLAKVLRTIILNWKRSNVRPDGTNPIVEKFRSLVKASAETKVTLQDGTQLKMRVKPKVGLGMKNQRRLDAAGEPKAFRALWTMPERVMCRIERQRDGATPTYAQAKRFEAALANGFQRTKPLRGQDLCFLRSSIYSPPTATDGCGRFEFFAGKNNRSILLKIKGELLELYELFLAVYRPIILGKAPDLGFVFVGQKGGSLARQALGRRIKKLVWQETGLRWNNHLWRHAAVVIIRDNGGSLETGADLLGITVQVAHAVYDKDRQVEAADALERAATAKLGSERRI